ncbi:MAG: YdcH family protein [Vicinamibacterales bacterium]
MEVANLKAQLLQSDQEYRELNETHHALDTRLAELTSRPHLSESEQLEEVELKKRKLQLKDRMEDIVRRHRPMPA